MENNTYKNYLSDFSHMIIERAYKARDDRQKYRETEKESFHAGILMGYRNVISLLQAQADAFQIPLDEIKLDKINPDKDLLEL